MESFLQSLAADGMPLVYVAVVVLFLGLAIRYRKARDEGRQNRVPAPASSDRLARVAAAGQPTKLVTEQDRAFVSKVLTGMVEQVRHEADLDAGRGQEAMVARLVPQIPIREHEERRSWLGGEPAMPARVAWPEAEGRQAVFLAQICCADLPEKVWDGLGPRQGWLAFFLHPVDTGCMCCT